MKNVEKNIMKRMNRFFDKPSGYENFPEESYALDPDNLIADKLENLNKTEIRIHINFTQVVSFWPKNLVHIQLRIHNIGSILCTEIKCIREIGEIKRSRIKVSWYKREKRILIPVVGGRSLEIYCKKIIVERFGQFSLLNGKLTPLKDVMNSLRKSGN